MLEIKCPYCHRESTITTAVREIPKFCLKETEGKIGLDHTHSYYQVETQMFVRDVEYSDFCVCTFASDTCSKENVHIERMHKDTDFWQECVPKVELFFRNCLLPEVLGKWYTRPTQCTSTSNPTSTPAISSTEQMYCYCRGPEESTMIPCDNPDCPIEWFHLECLHLRNVPKGKWFCPDCRKLSKFLKAKKKNE